MKKLIMSFVLLLIVLSVAFAEYVNGYYRSNGTYVNGYYRSDRNDTVRDNYSYKGNENPYTQEEGHNYYRKSKSSEYYGYDSKY